LCRTWFTCLPKGDHDSTGGADPSLFFEKQREFRPFAELTSLAAAQLLGTSDGTVELQFRLEDVLWGVNSLVLYYTNQKGTRTAEFMELSGVANYSG
jgi:hypothetical protein